MSDPTGAIFLSYASQDADAARRQAFAAQHHRDELATLLGPPGAGELSDDEFIETIRSVLDD